MNIFLITFHFLTGGWNTNPNATVFAAIFRSLLFRCGVRPSLNGNVRPQDGTELLAAGSELYSDEEPEEDVHFNQLSLYVEDVVVYIAGWIARNLQVKLKCMDCALCLTSQHAIPQNNSLIAIKDHGGLISPSGGVRHVCLRAEKLFRENDRVTTSQFTVNLLFKLTPDLFTIIFPELRDHHFDTLNGIDSHVTSLVRLICFKYFNLRKHHVAKRHNLRIHEKRMRSLYSHMLHYAYHQ